MGYVIIFVSTFALNETANTYLLLTIVALSKSLCLYVVGISLFDLLYLLLMSKNNMMFRID